MLHMTHADVEDAIASAMIGSNIASADAWSTLYTPDEKPATPAVDYTLHDAMPPGWDDSTVDPRMVTL